MNQSYQELINQNYKFPQKSFKLKDSYLNFNNIPLNKIIDKYGTPLRITYLPKITEQIYKSRDWFKKAFKNHNYKGKYEYCYCTKCNHYQHIITKVLESETNLETSSAFDLDLIISLHKKGEIPLNRTIIHNGYKTDEYLKKIIEFQEYGFINSITILDSISELDRLKQWSLSSSSMVKIGLRMAINEESKSSFNSSRLGIRSDKMLELFNSHILNSKKFELKMIHFFIDSGIKDQLYYWQEFQRALNIYAQIKKSCVSLNAFNIGGGFPIQNQLKFDYQYEQIIDKIVATIKNHCLTENISEPDIYTEFGKFTVGESSAIIFQVLEQKQQNETENWYIIDNSLLNTIPDAWYLHEKFILLPINKWDKEYQRVNIGGISCDQSDYYNSEDMNQEILLPKIEEDDKTPLYIGFFHTGAYQDAVSGYGGVKHCLVPSPKQIIVDIDKSGNLIDIMNIDEQNKTDVLKTLGYQ